MAKEIICIPHLKDACQGSTAPATHQDYGFLKRYFLKMPQSLMNSRKELIAVSIRLTTLSAEMRPVYFYMTVYEYFTPTTFTVKKSLHYLTINRLQVNNG
ncbi:MAG: hypothetical protein HY034_00785 [Nitrospirae bacterium]|nr:hypothetical protein [Nitrospirota bacterium]